MGPKLPLSRLLIGQKCHKNSTFYSAHLRSRKSTDHKEKSSVTTTTRKDLPVWFRGARIPYFSGEETILLVGAVLLTGGVLATEKRGRCLLVKNQLVLMSSFINHFLSLSNISFFPPCH